jgi:hypothetical protein
LNFTFREAATCDEVAVPRIVSGGTIRKRQIWESVSDESSEENEEPDAEYQEDSAAESEEEEEKPSDDDHDSDTPVPKSTRSHRNGGRKIKPLTDGSDNEELPQLGRADSRLQSEVAKALGCIGCSGRDIIVLGRYQCTNGHLHCDVCLAELDECRLEKCDGTLSDLRLELVLGLEGSRPFFRDGGGDSELESEEISSSFFFLTGKVLDFFFP